MAAHSGKEKHRALHHLSQRAGGDPNGWVESITGLTENQPATQLLNHGSKMPEKVRGMGLEME
jgi:hypothetical protein